MAEHNHIHDENCDCGCEPEMITLDFEDGSVDCEVMGVFDFEGKSYIALIPQDDTDDIYLYQYEELSEDEIELIDIEDEEEFKKVDAEFNRLMEEPDEE